MSDPIGTYTFLPWLRNGVANELSASGGAMRAAIDVKVALEGAKKGGGTTSVPIERKVELYGPGDVIGVDAAQISRLEPANWVTNFEPNYFPAIEFYDEDFPWRYTPAAPSGRKLLPWLALVVLEDTKEFKDGNAGATKRPLPFVEVTASFADVFADASEGWAWAHTHLNTELSSAVIEANQATASSAAQAFIKSSPDAACSRLLGPRKLKAKTAYHAFLMPAFESGRLAGLGIDPKPVFADASNGLTPTSSAWGAYPNRKDPTYFPFYFRWYFRTAEHGDFESLVRLLKPKPVNSRVGRRDVDVTAPAPNITGITDPALHGVLRLGGALRAPGEALTTAERAEQKKYDEWATPYPRPFQTQLAAFVNLADGYQQSGAAANANPALSAEVRADPDPMVTPPLYGRWHALTERLLTKSDGSDAEHRDNWVHELNLDPRWRTAAGFGTGVVQQTQETLMDAAWDQIGDVLEANRRIREAQLAKAANRRLHRSLRAAALTSPGALMMLASPMRARLLSGGVTVRKQLAESPMSLALTSSAMRRVIRPRGRVARKLELTAANDVGTLVARANAGEVSAAPPRVPPAKVLTPDGLAAAVAPKGALDPLLASLGRWINGHFALALVLLLVLVLLALLFGVAAAAVVLTVALVAGALARTVAGKQQAAENLREDSLTPATVDAMPGSSGFVLHASVDPRTAAPLPAVPAGQSDNAAAVQFKQSLRDEYRLIETSRALGQLPKTKPMDLKQVADDVLAGTKPELTVPRWIWSGVTIPARIREQLAETFAEVMAYPEFDTPMYEPLVKAGKDLFVPNLHEVERDSVTLLETNQPFIEAYMVGLNHELARELLWREYPTDQRGSYFRQFWDVRKKLATAPDPAAAREQLKDIPPLHEWPAASKLGDHDHREAGRANEAELVLVIRGELLKKYPNTVISAQPAKWQLTGGKPDKSKERVLDESVAPMVPLYEARVEPDLYFFGFDLTSKQARGDDTVDDKPGWFFRIEEVPGEARFGFDESREAGSELNIWGDLSWPDVAPALADGAPVKISSIPALSLVEPTGADAEKHDQWNQDRQVPLDSSLSSAELAYVSLQAPVLMAIHASELLLPKGASDV